MQLTKGRLRASLGALLAYAFIFDYAVYVYSPWQNWPEIFHKPSQLRLLLVADSRLSRSPGAFESLLAWDDERFVRRTFRAALEHVQPHAVAFLGDLFAEPPALPGETEALRRRFWDLFGPLNESTVSVVLPGERDLGTEPDDPHTVSLVRAFRREFGAARPHLLADGFELFPVDSLVFEQLARDAPARDVRPGSVRVMLSHAPVIPLLDVRLNWTVTLASPDVIFSAHELASALIRTTRRNPTDFASMVNAEQGQLERYLLSREDFLELVVPPCSSRVAYHTGYGIALFNKPVGGEATFDYAVLWTPMRALHLWGYAVVTTYGVTILVLPLAQLARFRWAWRKNFMR
ncbi:uncharacterized protein [Dermacentor albipictus]|uniref:uncharacterized protein n=1 Tax=Dermacentor albipictus TaxID=60249 RepID=UPI0031FD3153